MARFIRLHQKKDNKEEVFVNLDNVVSFKETSGLSTNMTRISTTSGETIYVTESAVDIYYLSGHV